jgi:fucose permease
VGLGIGSYEGVTDTMLLDLHPDQAASYININHFWVGVGKTGLAVYLLLLALNWRTSVTQAGVAVLVLAGVFALSYLPVRASAQNNLGERARVLARDWTVAVLFALAVLAVGIEVCSIGIMTTFLVELRGFSASQAQLGLIVYVAAIALGRLLVGLLVRTGRVAQWTVALFGAGVPLFLLLSFANLGPLTWLVIFAAGLGLSACLPLVLSLGGTRFPEMAGTVLGALKVGIPIGGILLPSLLSLLSSAAGLPVAMAILPAAFLLGLVLLAGNTATLFGPLSARGQVSPQR